LCAVGSRRGRTQSDGLRRITNTSEEAININPSISGDGRIVAFESTEDLAAAGGIDHFRAIRADVNVTPATFLQLAGTRAVSPAVSQDGSRIAFAARDDPLGSNPDGNSEIFLFDGSRLSQVTNTSPVGFANRITNGNFQPSITDDGRFLAFSSNRDLAGQNGDGNLEIFVFDSLSASFTQLTNSSGIVGFTDAKISGNGNLVAYIRDSAASPGRDLIEQPRTGGSATVLAAAVPSLTVTYGRAISDDGTRIVYSSQTATNTTQVFLYDGRGGPSIRQITSLGARVTEVPLHPSISGDGTRISFATRRNVNGGNSDGSAELYLYDLPTATFSRITDAPSSATGDVVSSLNDDGSIVAFSFSRVLSAAITNSDLANDSEIYLSTTQPRPSFGALTILNGASLGNEPATTQAVAPDSIAVARGGLLANSTQQAQRLANGAFPTNVGGTSVTVNGQPAQIFFVSPGQVNFLVPSQTEIGNADVIVTNSEGFPARGTVNTLRTAPGIFTKSGDGLGEALALNSDTLQEAPFDPSDGKLRLTIFATGARHAAQLSVTIGGQTVTPELALASPNMPGLDEIHVKAPASLKGAGVVTVSSQGDGRDGNPVHTRFVGGDLLINEVLADPPGAAAADSIGDANHDGVRSSSDDEFVELVNSTTHDLDISGYQLLARSSGAAGDTLRHRFAAGTIVAAQTAVVIFGGGAPNPSDPVFGNALVFKASTGGLFLSNSGGIVTLRDNSGAVANIFEYGGATGLSAGSNQSLTRSPDITGAFTGHATAPGAVGKLFSPGTRVDGTPFQTIPITRIDLGPASPLIDAGANQQFTARAFDAANQEVAGVIFFWQTSNSSVATIDQAGLATSLSPGVTQITAGGRGVQSAPDLLTVRAVQRVLTSVEVSPNVATIPATGAQQFNAKGLDQFGSEIPGLNFTWESSATNIVTVDQNGLAKGLAPGQSTIKVITQNISGSALLNVTTPTLVVNEVLADPPAGDEGDANHDGLRDGAQDEFVELVNASNVQLSISGWTLRTHSTTNSAETVRHTFAADTSVPAGNAIIVFGGGTFDAGNRLFGCAPAVKTSSAGLSLTNGGLTVLIRDASGNLVTEFSYGGSTGLNGGNAQSLTRSPDINGNLVLHSTPAAASGRKFSPGLKLDGTPFGGCPGHPASVSVSPSSTTTSGGQSVQFTAQAFDQFGRAMIGVPITFASDNNTVATIDSTTPNPITGVFIANIRALNPGTAHITASASDGVTNADGNQATLTVNGPALSIDDVTLNEGNSGITTFTFNVRLSQAAPAGGVTVDYATADGTATVAGSDYQSTNGTLSFVTGETSKTISVSINGDTLVEPDEAFVVNLTNVTGGAIIGDNHGTGAIQNDDAANLSISQVYPGGGLSAAAYTNDFIEIFNRGTTTVDFSITPYSVQFLSTTAATWSKTDLVSGRVLPGRYFLIKETSGGANGATLPTADTTGTLNLTSTTAGKVALVSGATLLTGVCPGDDGTSPFNPVNANIADFAGYGGTSTTANHCYEGSGPAAFTLSNNASAGYRKAGGCTDGNNNTADFFISTPSPRNSTSPTNNCSGGVVSNLSIDDVHVVEGNSGTTTATFTVSLSAPAQGADVTFDIATADGTATAANSDFVAKTLTKQIIPAGQTEYTFSVTVNGDVTIENDEAFLVNVTNVLAATVIDGQGQGTITNDDFPALSVDDVSATEGDAATRTLTFTVALSAPAPAPVTFDIATQDDSATTADNDYASSSLTGQMIAAGQQTFQFNVTVNGDLNIEPDETFFVKVTNVRNATVADGQGQGTIQNDDTPVLNINDVASAEGDSGTTTFTFTVTSTLAAPAGGITFDISTTDNSAKAGSDYIARSLTNQTIAEGNTTYGFDVTVNRDLLVEPNETFFVNVTNPGNAVIGDGQGLGTIQNDDVAHLSISQVYGGGNNTGATYQNDFVEIFNRGTTTVDFALTPYSLQYAGVGSNFGSNKTNLTTGSIAPGKYFLLKESGGTTNGAALPTADATGSINLGSTAGKVALVAGTNALDGSTCPGDDAVPPFNAGDLTVVDLLGYGNTANTSGHCYEGAAPAAALSNTTADFRRAGGCTDTNDNSADALTSTPFPRNSARAANNCAGGATPTLSINNVTVTEGNSGTTTATFTVSLSAPSQGTDVAFDIATQDSTATTANNDYVAKSLTNQIIPAGQTTYSFSITVNGDNAVEPNETFFVNVTNASGATVTNAHGIGTIQHDDLPALSIDDLSAFEGDGGTTTFTFHVSLSAAAPAIVTFDIATADNSATTGDNDYVSQALTNQTIAQGGTSYTFQVTVNGDQNIEASETFLVNISNVNGATSSDGQGQGTIQNDDSPILSINSVAMPEGDSGTTIFTFTVTSNLPAPASGIAFDLATANNTATSASGDYVANSINEATIPPGQTSCSFDVTVNSDTSPEPDQTFFVDISNPSNGATISGSQGIGTIQNDDGPIIVISQIYPGGGLTNATYTNDFVEIFNRSGDAIDFSVTPYSIQFLSAAGSTWTKTDLASGTIAPGGYFLIKESGGANGAALPATDASGSINLTSTTAGKVALVAGTALLTGNCPGDDGPAPFNPANANIVDFVGYGGTAATASHCYEGTGPAPFTFSNNTIATFRKSGGCIDTNDNSADLVTAPPMPRNTSAVINDCSTGFRPDISIADPAAITEGNGGTSTLNFTVTLSAPNNTQTVTVDFSTADGAASAGSDYQAASGTVTFNPSETTKTIPITVNGDLLDEPNETFFVNLSNATNGAILDNRGVGTINDNDPAPALSINDQPNITEGDTGTSVINFTVTLSAASGQTVTVDFATANATATAGTDYVATSGTLIFNPGDTAKSIPLTINGDATDETDEIFFVNLSNVSPTATISDSQGQGTIKNDDAAMSADLSLTKTPSSSIVVPGNNINYTITLQNLGPDSSSGAMLADTIPANTPFQSITPPPGWTCMTPAINDTGNINCSKAAAFMVSTVSFPLTVNVNAGTPVGTQIINTAQVTSAGTDSNSVNNSATATVNVVAANSADLAITTTDSTDPVAIGNNLNYTIVLTNNGPMTAANPSFVDSLPAEVNFRSLSAPPGWTCVTPAMGGSGSINCSSGTSISVNGTATFGLVVRVNPTVADATVISNTVNATTTTTDSVSTNNSATSQTTAKAPQLVITQIYPGGGNSGATYTNDFIEIFNRGTTTVDFALTNYSVQYESAAGASWSKTDITSGTLAPGQYFLIREAGGANGAALPAPDATGSINLTASGPAKIALVAGTTLLTSACPGDDGTQPFNPNNASIVDFTGYAGTAATSGHCYLGSGPAPFSTSTNPNARSTIRTAAAVCTASINNAADFTNPTSAPLARNTATTLSPCP
jgi:uncharacterized repeat protein (TIGR01451 family)